MEADAPDLPPDAGVRRRRRYDRASILDGLRLADGRLAWPVARSLGINEATFRARLKAGRSPDDAVAAPLSRSEAGRLGAAASVRRRASWRWQARGSKWDRVRLADGRLASDAAAAAGVSRGLLHLRLSRGWSPERAATERPWAARDEARAAKDGRRRSRRDGVAPPRSGCAGRGNGRSR